MRFYINIGREMSFWSVWGSLVLVQLPGLGHIESKQSPAPMPGGGSSPRASAGLRERSSHKLHEQPP